MSRGFFLTADAVCHHSFRRGAMVRLAVAWVAFESVAWADGAETSPLTTEINSTTASATNTPASALEGGPAQSSLWNWHVQNTVVVQTHGRFPALYSGDQSLTSTSETKQTVSFDVFAGVKLWHGAELHADALVWQGFGLSHTFGVAGFPNNEAFKGGTELPNITLAHLLVQQTFELGGEKEEIPDGQLQLAKQVDSHRLTISVGKMSAKDSFDGNTYSNDGRLQFMNWALVSAGAWDFPADSLGYMPGITADLHLTDWSVRYGIFQVPRVANGLASDPHPLEAWGMVAEIERRWPGGAARLLFFANRANMRRFDEITDPSVPRDTTLPPSYHLKPGFGINVEQIILPGVGAFSRLSWNNGETESWAYTDIDKTISLGLSFNGIQWSRPMDTFGLAGVFNGLSGGHRGYLAAGGMGVTVGDGGLRYGTEAILETYYDAKIWKTIHLTFDYSFVSNPAYNQDRGPVHIFAGRVHWEY